MPHALDPASPDAAGHRVVLIVGGKVFGLSDALPTVGRVRTSIFDLVTRITPIDKGSVVLECVVPTQNVRDLPVVQVVDPFWGERYRAEAAIEDDSNTPPVVTSMKVIAVADSFVLFAIEGSRFKTANLKLVIGTKEILKTTQKQDGYKILSDKLLIFPVTYDDLKSVRQLVVVDQGSLLGDISKRATADPVLLAIPELRLPKPKIISQETVIQGTAGPVRFDGVNFSNLESVRYAGKSLEFHIDGADPAVMYVTLIDAAVRDAGDKELQLFARSGDLFTYRLRVDPKK